MPFSHSSWCHISQEQTEVYGEKKITKNVIIKMVKQHEKGIEYHKTCLALDNTCTRFL